MHPKKGSQAIEAEMSIIKTPERSRVTTCPRCIRTSGPGGMSQACNRGHAIRIFIGLQYMASSCYTEFTKRELLALYAKASTPTEANSQVRSKEAQRPKVPNPKPSLQINKPKPSSPKPCRNLLEPRYRALLEPLIEPLSGTPSLRNPTPLPSGT